MTANRYEEWSTRPDPKYGYPRGVYYGEDALGHLEALPPDTLFTWTKAAAFLKGCGVSPIKAGGIPLGALSDQPIKHIGPLIGFIRQHYGVLETAAMMAEPCPYVAEVNFPIPNEWRRPEVKKYLLSLPMNTIILDERSYCYLKISGVTDVWRFLLPREFHTGTPGKKVGAILKILEVVELEEQRRGDAPISPTDIPYAPLARKRR